MQQILGYKEWRYFQVVIERTQIACSQSNNDIGYNLGVNTKIVNTVVSTKPVIDYKLSRYACCLIVQNVNFKYKVVSLWQTGFNIQTKKRN